LRRLLLKWGVRREETKPLLQIQKRIVVMVPRVVESLDTLNSSRALASGQEIRRRPPATLLQADSRVSTYIARPLQASKLTDAILVVMAINV
jgi:hypothetical protein